MKKTQVRGLPDKVLGEALTNHTQALNFLYAQVQQIQAERKKVALAIGLGYLLTAITWGWVVYGMMGGW